MESKVMVGSETNMVVGMETGVNMAVGMDSKLVVDTSGNAGAVVIVEADPGAGTGSTVVGTGVSVNVAAAVVEIQVGVGTIASACVAVRVGLAPVGAQTNMTAGVEMDVVVGSEPEVEVVADMEMNVAVGAVTDVAAAEVDVNIVVGSEMKVAVVVDIHAGTGAGSITSVCVVASACLALAGAQHITAAAGLGIGLETVQVAGAVWSADVDVAAVCAEIGMAVAGVSRCECKNSDISRFNGRANGRENWSMCSF